MNPPRIHAATATYTPTLGALHKRGEPSSTGPSTDSRRTTATIPAGLGSPAWRPPAALRVGSYLPTVWLASCLIRLNCFFILRVCALPRASSRISLIERRQISALIYGRRQGSLSKHPVSGISEAKSSPFLPMATAFLGPTLRSGAQKMLDRFLFFSPPRLTAH